METFMESFNKIWPVMAVMIAWFAATVLVIGIKREVEKLMKG